MNLFEEYKKRRNEYYMTAKQAYQSASHAAAEAWRKELRGWDFNLRMILSNMTEDHRKVWTKQLPSGHYLVVKASYDYDVDQLDGLCKVEHHTYREHRDQECVSHKDGGIETGWYRKQGMAKQPAIERAIEARKRQVEWIEDYMQGNCTYGCFEVVIKDTTGHEDDSDDGNEVAQAGPLGGVECDDDEYLLDTLNELFDEATHGLTL